MKPFRWSNWNEAHLARERVLSDEQFKALLEAPHRGGFSEFALALLRAVSARGDLIRLTP